MSLYPENAACYVLFVFSFSLIAPILRTCGSEGHSICQVRESRLSENTKGIESEIPRKVKVGLLIRTINFFYIYIAFGSLVPRLLCVQFALFVITRSSVRNLELIRNSQGDNTVLKHPVAFVDNAIRTNTHIHVLYFFFHWLYSPLGPWTLISFFSFMIVLRTVGLLGRVISSSQGLYLNTGQHKHRINTYT
jgi:hypothetical protein